MPWKDGTQTPAAAACPKPRADFPYGEVGRWIEVAPRGSSIAVALVPPSEGQSAGSDEARCALTTEDIQAVHATLRARGVEVDAEIARTGRPGPDWSRSRPQSWIPCQRSSSSATPTEIAS
jgi:hypothetical protein